MTEPSRDEVVDLLARLARGGSACSGEEVRTTAIAAMRALGVKHSDPRLHPDQGALPVDG